VVGLIDPNEDETPDRLNAMAIMAAFDALPDVVRAAILMCEFQVSPFRARWMLSGPYGDPDLLAEIIGEIRSREDLDAFHGVTPKFARGASQPKEQEPNDHP
jgi:hypothetical protein